MIPFIKNFRFSNINSTASDVVFPLTVDLTQPFVVQTIPEYQIAVSKIEVIEITDNSVNKTVIATTKNRPYEIVLWEGAAYDAIGQWTDADVRARITELFT